MTSSTAEKEGAKASPDQPTGKPSPLLVGDGRRSVPEWQGVSPDSPIPPRVKVRVFQRHDGRCYLTGKKLRPGEFDFDHIIALANGGLNVESNLAPIWRPAHREKTAKDVAVKSKTDRMTKKHLGLWPKSRGFSSKYTRKLGGSVVERKVRYSGDIDHEL